MENKEKVREVQKKWDKKNPERVKAKSKKYCDNHREIVNLRYAKYKLENPEKVKESASKWREGNKEKIKEYYQKNKSSKRFLEIRRERSAKWAKQNKQKIRERYAENPNKGVVKSQRYRARLVGCEGSYTTQEWLDLCAYYDNKCLRCGRDDVKLTVDHVIPISKGGSNSIDNLQPLCRSCNSSKGVSVTDYRP